MYEIQTQTSRKSELTSAQNGNHEVKAQIYSVNENLPADQVARMWCVLDQLERTRRKEKKSGEVAVK